MAYLVNWGVTKERRGWNLFDAEDRETPFVIKQPSPMHLCEHVSLVELGGQGYVQVEGEPEIEAPPSPR